MRISDRSPSVLPRLAEFFETNGTVYGHGSEYSSLLSNSVLSLSGRELETIRQDLDGFARLYRFASSLYLSSLNDPQLNWIQRAVEAELRPAEVSVTRRLAGAHCEPRMVRADYVDVGTGRRDVAEIQWKSGGPGFFFGHQLGFADCIPLDHGEEVIGNLAASYLHKLTETADSIGPGVIANEVRPEWLRGEHILERMANSDSVSYRPVSRDEIASDVRVEGTRLMLKATGGWEPIATLRGRGFTDRLPDPDLMWMADAVIAERLWVESPPNFLYRQKWPLVIPYMPELCPSDLRLLRHTVPPTSMVGPHHFDLSAIADHPDWQGGRRLSAIRSLAELADLPTSIRGMLVLKCAAGSGDFHSGGRGVFRLNGTGRQAKDILGLIARRQKDLDEPWIAQLYAGRSWPASLAHRQHLEQLMQTECRLRLMVFGQTDQSNHDWIVTGAVGNLGPHWKVSGSSANIAVTGRLIGSAFTDVRLQVASGE